MPNITLLQIMYRFGLWQLSIVIKQLQLRQIAMAQMPEDESLSPNYVTQIRGLIDYARILCDSAQLQTAIQRIDAFSEDFNLPARLTCGRTRIQVEVLLDAIDNDLGERWFIFVPIERAKLLELMPVVWHDVWETLPTTQYDTEQAVRCYAIDGNTACVFHMMRVAEYGLRALGKKLNIKLTHSGKRLPLEYGEWDTVINAIGNKIKETRSRPRGPKKEERLRLYSNAADHCSYMKDIWRNEVSHTRREYSASEALSVINRVEGFMKFLAAIL